MKASKGSLRLCARAAIDCGQSRVPVLWARALRLLNRGSGGRATLAPAVRKPGVAHRGGQVKSLARQMQCRSMTMEGPQPGAMASSALAYGARGWSVIPMRPCGKRPLLAWREYQQRIAGADEIARWFRRWPDANVGVVTRRISGIVVVDVDIRHGGPHSVVDAEARNGPLQDTVEAATGGGGRHLYYPHPGPVMANRVAMRSGVDLRGDGGGVIAPPSAHPNGKRHTWATGRAPGDVALAPLPPHFGGACVAPPALGRSRGHWRRRVRGGVGEEARNNTIASRSGHLLRRGVDADVACELMLAWNRSHCRPPLADAEVVRVVGSITRLHGTEGGASE
jgi:hypothetical protein